MSYKVFTDFLVGRDDVLTHLRQQKNATEKTAKSLVRNTAKTYSKVAGFTRGVVMGNVITRGMWAVQNSVRSVITDIIEFDGALTEAGARFDFVKGTEGFKALEARSRSLAASTKFTAKEVAEGFKFFAMAGFNLEEAFGGVPSAINIATAAGVDMKQATDWATDTMNAFGLSVDEAGNRLGSSKIGANFQRVAGVLAMAANKTNASLEDVFNTIKRGAPDEAALGMTIETFATLLDAMSEKGVKGRLAAVPMKNLWSRIITPAAGGAKYLRRLGVTKKDIQDAQGNVLPLLGETPEDSLLHKIQQGLGRLGTAEREQTIKKIWGREGSAGIINILTKPVAQLIKRRNEVYRQAFGYDAVLAARIEQSIPNKIAKIRSAAVELGLRSIDKYGKDIPDMLEKIHKAIMGFDPGKVVFIIDNIVKLIKFIAKNRDTIFALGKLYLTLKLVSAGFSFGKAVGGVFKLTTALAGANTMALKVLGSLGSIAASGAVGYAAGTVLSKTVLEPMADEAAQERLSRQNLIERPLVSKDPAERIREIDTLALRLRERTKTPSIRSVEDLIGVVGELFGGPESGRTREHRLNAATAVRLRELLAEKRRLVDQLDKPVMMRGANGPAATEGGWYGPMGNKPEINVVIHNAPPGITAEVVEGPLPGVEAAALGR